MVSRKDKWRASGSVPEQIRSEEGIKYYIDDLDEYINTINLESVEVEKRNLPKNLKICRPFAGNAPLIKSSRPNDKGNLNIIDVARLYNLHKTSCPHCLKNIELTSSLWNLNDAYLHTLLSGKIIDFGFAKIFLKLGRKPIKHKGDKLFKIRLGIRPNRCMPLFKHLFRPEQLIKLFVYVNSITAKAKSLLNLELSRKYKTKETSKWQK